MELGIQFSTFHIVLASSLEQVDRCLPSLLVATDSPPWQLKPKITSHLLNGHNHHFHNHHFHNHHFHNHHHHQQQQC